LLDQALAGTFDPQAAPNRQTKVFQVSVVDMVTVLVQIVVDTLERLSGSGWQVGQEGSSLEVLQDLRRLTMPNTMAGLNKLRLGPPGAPV
jgi:hypothetical protein